MKKSLVVLLFNMAQSQQKFVHYITKPPAAKREVPDKYLTVNISHSSTLKRLVTERVQSFSCDPFGGGRGFDLESLGLGPQLDWSSDELIPNFKIQILAESIADPDPWSQTRLGWIANLQMSTKK